MTARQKYLFVLNPIAGDADKSDLVDLIEEKFGDRLPEILWTEPDTESYLADIIHAGQYDAVVAAGGDGTVHMVAEALRGTEIPLGILPMGSGNGLAKDLGLPLRPEDALYTVLAGEPATIDGIELNGSRYYHIADAGLNAHVIRDYALGSFRTVRAYAWHLLKFYFSAGASPIEVTVDGSIAFQGAALMISFCNGRRYGSDIIINPQGKLDDGLIEIVVLRDFPKSAGPGLLLELMDGELDPEYLSVFQGKEIHVKTEHAWPWQIDGEFLGYDTEFQARMVPQVLRVIR